MNEVRYTLRQLEYFVAVAETGTISAAAQRCHVSAPGLSLALSELERALGVQLFTRRRSKGASLTAAGHTMLAHARTVLAEAGLLQESARAEGGGMVGRLAVGCYTTLSPFAIPRLLTGFVAEHPLMQLSFQEASQPVLERDLISGTLELAIMYQHNVHPELRYDVLSTQRHYVLLPVGHPLADEEEVSLRALADEPLVLFDVSPARENLERIAGAVGVAPTIGHRTQNFELVRSLVASGFGYGILLQRPSIDLTYDGNRVVSRPIKEKLSATAIVVAHVADTRLTVRAQRFRDFAIAEFAGSAV